MPDPVVSHHKVPSVLIVARDQSEQDVLYGRLTSKALRVLTVGTADEAEALLRAARVDVILLDDQVGGTDLLARAIDLAPAASVVVLTESGSIEAAVKAIRLGASSIVERSRGIEAVCKEIEALARNVAWHGPSPDVLAVAARLGFWGEGAKHASLLERLARIAPVDAAVLITGESGTGKELAARTIHELSGRKGRFVAVNCGAIPATLLESELFGHKRGAFTGAVRDRTGLFETAAGGTILLDEIGEMPLSLQVKLLRVLQERQVRPLGSNTTVPLEARILAATNRDCEEAVRRGELRLDLYFRLSVVTVSLPPLRERMEDIPVLVRHFVEEFNQRHGLQVTPPGPDVLSRLAARKWPGNIRELRNVVERAAILSRSGPLRLEEAFEMPEPPAHNLGSLGPGRPVTLAAHLQACEREYLRSVLALTGGNVAEAARLAGVYRGSFYRMMDRHDINPRRFKAQAIARRQAQAPNDRP